MRAVTKHIEGVPPDFEAQDDYSSHRPLLWLALVKTKGQVVEFGMGHGSTFWIDDLCGRMSREFNSYENDLVWLEEVKSSKETWCGELWYIIDDYQDIELDNVGLLFIDGKPGESRKYCIERNANIANVLLIHDTEPNADYVYGMKDILSTFKYRLDYQPEGFPHTTAVSNTINVCTWI